MLLEKSKKKENKDHQDHKDHKEMNVNQKKVVLRKKPKVLRENNQVKIREESINQGIMTIIQFMF